MERETPSPRPIPDAVEGGPYGSKSVASRRTVPRSEAARRSPTTHRKVAATVPHSKAVLPSPTTHRRFAALACHPPVPGPGLRDHGLSVQPVPGDPESRCLPWARERGYPLDAMRTVASTGLGILAALLLFLGAFLIFMGVASIAATAVNSAAQHALHPRWLVPIAMFVAAGGLVFGLSVALTRAAIRMRISASAVSADT